MRRHLLVTTAAVAAFAGAMVLLPPVSAAQAPTMERGDAEVISIPVDDPVKAIAGALFRPASEGPFPTIVFLGGCGPVGDAEGRALEKSVIDHDLHSGFATLIVDSFAPRGLAEGVCDRRGNPVWFGIRAADAHAAKGALTAMPEIDARRIFLVGYDHGGTAALLAADRVAAAQHKATFAGVIAYYPYCGFTCGCAFSVPTLILAGDADEIAPGDRCRPLKDTPNAELVIYPGAAHGFATPGVGTSDDGRRVAYDAKAAADAQARADAFIAAHMK